MLNLRSQVLFKLLIKKGKYNNKQESLQKRVLNLQELIFYKNPNFPSTDPNVIITNPACFNYYVTHDICNL